MVHSENTLQRQFRLERSHTFSEFYPDDVLFCLGAFIANFSNSLLGSTGGYASSFVMMLVLAVCALELNFSIRKP